MHAHSVPPCPFGLLSFLYFISGLEGRENALVFFYGLGFYLEKNWCAYLIFENSKVRREQSMFMAQETHFPWAPWLWTGKDDPKITHCMPRHCVELFAKGGSSVRRLPWGLFGYHFHLSWEKGMVVCHRWLKPHWCQVPKQTSATCRANCWCIWLQALSVC